MQAILQVCSGIALIASGWCDSWTVQPGFTLFANSLVEFAGPRRAPGYQRCADSSLPSPRLRVDIFGCAMASADATSGESGNKLSSQLTSAWKSRNASQLRTIKEACTGNLELQMLVLQTIDRYKVGVATAGASGATVAQIMGAKKKTKPQQDGGGERFELSDASKVITRARAMYSKWSRQWLAELLHFITKGGLQYKDLMERFADRPRLLEMLERGLDVRVTGENQDKVGDVNDTKLNLYEACATVYEMRGTPLRGIADAFGEDGSIDWLAAGHYALLVDEKPEGQQVSITLKSQKKLTRVMADVIADDNGPWTIKKNWSVQSAYLSSPKDEYAIKYFFPGGHRKLARQSSADLRVILVVCGGDGNSLKGLAALRSRLANDDFGGRDAIDAKRARVSNASALPSVGEGQGDAPPAE